jgi:hypothetical protein
VDCTPGRPDPGTAADLDLLLARWSSCNVAGTTSCWAAARPDGVGRRARRMCKTSGGGSQSVRHPHTLLRHGVVLVVATVAPPSRPHPHGGHPDRSGCGPVDCGDLR